jgi:hypothetical protein
MIEIDDALCAAMSSDAQIATMLGSPAISSQWPEGNETFADLPNGFAGDDFGSLPPADPPRARVTVSLQVPDEDPEVPTHQDEYQIDIWSRSARLNAAIARRVKQILDREGLAVSGYVIQETYCTYGPDLYEPADRLHHKVLIYHVTWVGTA